MGACLALTLEQQAVAAELFASLDAAALTQFAADLKRARAEARSGTIALRAELSRGKAGAECWVDSSLRPSKPRAVAA